MYRLLIVDDEPYTRQRIRAAINWEMMNIQIVGEAENGIQGLAAAMEQTPDIVICDVRMPGMDGISFATELLHHFPSVQFIFISGYSDKMYLKNALQLEAVDYIFKPYEFSDLLYAIEKAITRIKSKKQSTANSDRTDMALQLVYYAQNQNELQHFLDSHIVAIDLNRPWIALLVRFCSGLSFSNYQSQELTDTLQPQILISQYYYTFEQELMTIFQKRCLISKGRDSYLVFANLPEVISSLKEKLSRLLSIVPTVPLVIGISQSFQKPLDIREAFLQARQASFCGFLSGYHKIYDFRFCSSRRFSPLCEAKSDFLSALERHNIAVASSFLDDYIAYMADCSCDDILIIKEELLQISLKLFDRLNNPPFQLISNFINTAASLSDIQQYLHYLLECYQSELDSLDSKGRIIYEAEQYILNHLGENLSIRQIADSVYLSSTYLCYLYKKKTGKTLNQFILDSRMEKAKSLLLNTNMKIGDIATSLGYSNQNYFAKLFAAHFGTTPSSFRNHN